MNAIGWDVGGAHLKVVALDAQGHVVHASQLPCTLWCGMEHLTNTATAAMSEIDLEGAQHAVTMTGELADCFDSRSDGVRQILHTVAPILGSLRVWSRDGEFLSVQQALDLPMSVASANWHAAARFVAAHINDALLIDIGSTTTDVTLVAGGEVAALGRDDHSRLAHDELLYTGIVRSPLMSIASRARFKNRFVNVMAEHFATTADVYRLTGGLPQNADQSETADRREKTIDASARRLARMVGCDIGDAGLADWRQLAAYFAEQQLQRIVAACKSNLAREAAGGSSAVVGAGAGAFLARKAAQRLDRQYHEMSEWVYDKGMNKTWSAGPAFAVAWLFQQRL